MQGTLPTLLDRNANPGVEDLEGLEVTIYAKPDVSDLKAIAALSNSIELELRVDGDRYHLNNRDYSMIEKMLVTMPALRKCYLPVDGAPFGWKDRVAKLTRGRVEIEAAGHA
jgi:hypothetical protein